MRPSVPVKPFEGGYDTPEDFAGGRFPYRRLQNEVEEIAAVAPPHEITEAAFELDNGLDGTDEKGTLLQLAVRFDFRLPEMGRHVGHEILEDKLVVAFDFVDNRGVGRAHNCADLTAADRFAGEVAHPQNLLECHNRSNGFMTSRQRRKREVEWLGRGMAGKRKREGEDAGCGASRYTEKVRRNSDGILKMIISQTRR
jgi:hypothetical protein